MCLFIYRFISNIVAITAGTTVFIYFQYGTYSEIIAINMCFAHNYYGNKSSIFVSYIHILAKGRPILI